MAGVITSNTRLDNWFLLREVAPETCRLGCFRIDAVAKDYSHQVERGEITMKEAQGVVAQLLETCCCKIEPILYVE